MAGRAPAIDDSDDGEETTDSKRASKSKHSRKKSSRAKEEELSSDDEPLGAIVEKRLSASEKQEIEAKERERQARERFETKLQQAGLSESLAHTLEGAVWQSFDSSLGRTERLHAFTRRIGDLLFNLKNNSSLFERVKTKNCLLSIWRL
eukprot:GABV01009046.1.p1 GENE.GABV01009046.1~~GABV01009046.1.p1  ORF type:complete len:149 (+),score=46.12 GABV01009046.1:287-733(+)